MIFRFFGLLMLLSSPLSLSLSAGVTSGYFYGDTDWEGFAGYCAVITPEFKEVSKKMVKRLNITYSPHVATHSASVPSLYAAFATLEPYTQPISPIASHSFQAMATRMTPN